MTRKPTSQPKSITKLRKPSPAKSFRHKVRRTKPIVIKDRSFKGPIRKNQRRTEYFA